MKQTLQTLPAYQDYTVRAQVSEGAIAASSIKIGVTELFADRGLTGVAAYATELAVAATQANLVTDRISGIVVDGATGEIVVTMQMAQLAANEDDLAYMPQIKNLALNDTTNSSGSIEWVCSPNPAAGVAANTTILNAYLPAVCR